MHGPRYDMATFSKQLRERLTLDNKTLIGRQLRMPQMQGRKDDAVVGYREPFLTQQMGYHRVSQRVNKIEKK